MKKANKLIEQGKLYGTTTMGARGQVVIPAEARKELNLQPGDQLLVVGRFGKVVGLMKTEDLDEIKEYINKIFGNIKHRK